MGLTPNEVDMGRLPRLPVAILERPKAGGNRSLNRDHLAYCNLARDRQQRAYDIARQQHALTVTRIERWNSALAAGLRKTPTYAGGQRIWAYSPAATIRQDATKDTGDKVLETKLSYLDGTVQISCGGSRRRCGAVESAPDGDQTPIPGSPR